MEWVILGFPALLGIWALVFTLAAPFHIVRKTGWRLGMIDRRKCEGFDDPEERCPYSAKACICWQGRTVQKERG